MIERTPLSPPNSLALDEDIIDAISAQQSDTILTPEMQERVRSRLLQRIERDTLIRPTAVKPAGPP